MTFTLLGHCPRTGQVGIGVATYSLVVGMLCPAIRGDAGVISSQAFVNFELRTLGLNLLAQGHPAEQPLALMKQADPQIEFRQLMVLDRFGRAAGFTGSKTRPWTGHKSGQGYVAAGKVLAGEHVVDAMIAAFTAAPERDLDERLLSAIEAGRPTAPSTGCATSIRRRRHHRRSSLPG